MKCVANIIIRVDCHGEGPSYSVERTLEIFADDLYTLDALRVGKACTRLYDNTVHDAMMQDIRQDWEKRVPGSARAARSEDDTNAGQTERCADPPF